MPAQSLCRHAQALCLQACRCACLRIGAHVRFGLFAGRRLIAVCAQTLSKCMCAGLAAGGPFAQAVERIDCVGGAAVHAKLYRNPSPSEGIHEADERTRVSSAASCFERVRACATCGVHALGRGSLRPST
eukprot:6208124-Pleurochrysis_carterae.AAC.2